MAFLIFTGMLIFLPILKSETTAFGIESDIEEDYK